MKALKLVYLCVLAIVAYGCGSAQKTDLEDPTGRNGWITRGGRIYKSGESVVVEGVGSAQGIKNVPLARETCDSRARADVASRLETVITRLREDYMQSISDMSNEPMEEQLVRATGKELVTQVLSGVQIVDRHFDEKNNIHYSYAKLDMGVMELASRFKSAVKPVVAERIKSNSAEAFKRLDTSVENYLQKNIPTATDK